MVLYKVLACFLLVQAFSAVLGDDVAKDEYRYVVSVHDSSNNGLKCVGVLLGNDVVLTSARCVVPAPNQAQPKLFVKFGALDYTQTGGQIQKLLVNYTTPHPNFDNKTTTAYKEYDLALLKLIGSVSGYNSTIKFPEENAAVNQSHPATMVAYKFYPTSEKNNLKKYKAYVIDNNQCKDTIQNARQATLFDSQFCASSPVANIYTINGDTGAPLIQKIGEDEVLIGIASATSTQTQDLKDNSIFTNIALYSEWIEKNANGSERVAAFGYLMMALTLITIFKNLFN